MSTSMKQYIITCCLGLLTVASVLWIERCASKKIAVVDAVRLFNAYHMKKELENQSGKKLDKIGHIADSLKTDISLKMKEQHADKAALEQEIEAYRRVESAYDQEYQASNQSINEEVWKRLNPLIDEYGKKNGLRLIIGANGMGSVLYHTGYYDHTEKVIEFVNQRYEKGY